jgi:hypothetical protein
MREREQQVDQQVQLMQKLSMEQGSLKDQMDKERLRLVSLFSQFEVSMGSFQRDNETDRRKHSEGLAHLEAMRGQGEKDRKLALNEVTSERRLLEQQHNEFVDRKMTAMTELQEERTAVQKERAEWTLLRERQTRDETALLASLRSKEETLTERADGMQDDRRDIADMKREAARVREEALAERHALSGERMQFDAEKGMLEQRIDEVQRRAEDAANVQTRLRKDIAEERVSSEQRLFTVTATGGHGGRGSGAFQVDLARQRAVLNRIESKPSPAAIREAPF